MIHYQLQRQCLSPGVGRSQDGMQFSPFKGAYIHYIISRLEWNPSYVMFGAKAKFSATIEGKNITFNPAVSTYLIYIMTKIT